MTREQALASARYLSQRDNRARWVWVDHSLEGGAGNHHRWRFALVTSGDAPWTQAPYYIVSGGEATRRLPYRAWRIRKHMRHRGTMRERAASSLRDGAN
jgi:hypothetical protein